MEIGIPKETKKGERRIALTPEYVRKLVDEGHIVFVEENAGIGCGFSNEDYEDAGARIALAPEIYNQPMVVRVKEPPIDTLRNRQTLMGYLHIEKKQIQNAALLDALLQKEITAYAFEEIRDEKGFRQVNLGLEAGIVGMFEGLRAYGNILEEMGKPNPFQNIRQISEYESKESAYRELRKIFPNDFSANVVIAGYGNVSKGAQEVLAQLSHPPTILKEEDTLRTRVLGQEFSYVWNYLRDADIFVNAIVWFPRQDRVLTKKDLERMKDKSLIVDISCDREGGIETTIPTTWENPTYSVNTSNGKKIIHYCVDNLPSGIARESSISLSRMIYPYVRRVAKGELLETGLMTKEGKLVFKKLKTKDLNKSS